MSNNFEELKRAAQQALEALEYNSCYQYCRKASSKQVGGVAAWSQRRPVWAGI